MNKTDEKGSALLEFLPASALLMVLVGVILGGAYLLFGRAWIQYHSEQALYCAAQSGSPFKCKTELENELSQFLPWGDSLVRIHAEEQLWTVEVQWQYGLFSLHIEKELTPKQILQPKVLQW